LPKSLSNHLEGESEPNVTMKRRCPVCRKIFELEVSFQEQSKEEQCFPFCSERCKLTDLGAWLDGKYRIMGESKSENSGDSPNSSPGAAEDKK
jgi:endogenous inhibitor of DNA gyrase (YacG/DUF329 family)